MNRSLVPVALAVLVLLAGCIAPLQTGSTDAAPDARTVSVSGTGEVTADADLAVVSVSVVAAADTADAARQRVATDVESMRTALRDAGVPDDAVSTESFRIQPQYRDGNGGESAAERTPTGYRAVHAFRIEVAPGEAGNAIDAAVADGADRVDGVRFTLTDETRADLRADAIAKAMSAARSDAEAVAAAENLELDGLRSASTSPDYLPYADVRYAEAAGGSGASTDLEPGPVTVSADVQVTYDVA